MAKHIHCKQMLLQESFIDQNNRNIPQDSIVTIDKKMLIKMLLHVNFIPLKFSVILLVIVPPYAKCICSFSYIFIIRNFTFKQIDQALIITIKLMIYLESFTCDSTRKGFCFYDISIKYMKMGNLGTL